MQFLYVETLPRNTYKQLAMWPPYCFLQMVLKDTMDTLLRTQLSTLMVSNSSSMFIESPSNETKNVEYLHMKIFWSAQRRIRMSLFPHNALDV